MIILAVIITDNVIKVRVTKVRTTYEVKWEVLSVRKVLANIETSNAGPGLGNDR